MLKSISKMNVWELFDVVLFYPEYIGDSYYKDIHTAIDVRFEQLKKEHYSKEQPSMPRQEEQPCAPNLV